MSERASKVNKLSEHNQENSSTSKKDSEVDTSLQLTTSIIETDSCIEMSSRTDESEISVLSTVPMDDSNISVTTNSSIHLASRINEAGISVQPTTSINNADISVEAIILLKEADISVQTVVPINEADNPVKPTTWLNEAGTSVPQTTPINEAEMSTRSTTPINEAEMSTRSTTPMSDADISVEAATSMSKAAIFVQPTSSRSEAGIYVKPTYPCNVEYLTDQINKVTISVQSTVPMTVAIIPGQSSAAMHDADSFVEPIHEADPNAQPTDQISEEDLSLTEEYQEAFRIFQWIEVKLDLLKIVQGNDENDDNNAQNEHRDMSLNEKSTLLERIMEEIGQQMTSTNIAEKDGYFSKEVTRLLNMLQETTLEVLDSVKVAKSKLTSFQVLAVLIKHLSADIGSEVKLHDVQTFIDGPRVMKLFTDVQIAREPRYLKMSVVISNLELGIRKAQYVKRKSRWYKSKAQWIDSECARTVDVRSANQQLKTLAIESEKVLLKYKESVKFVLTKAKVFMTLKIDNEDVLGYFLTTEIHDMYKKES